MATKQTFHGFATVSFFADDMQAAQQWYTELFGVEPYFRRPEEGDPGYLEWRIGDYQHEFGIVNSKFLPGGGGAAQPGGAILYWHVDDLEGTLERLKIMGAQDHLPITPRGAGFITASVIDPFGNILGIMTNPHYLEIVNKEKKLDVFA
jgi:predicted enzyme related to lactoylglutathione lyase